MLGWGPSVVWSMEIPCFSRRGGEKKSKSQYQPGLSSKTTEQVRALDEVLQDSHLGQKAECEWASTWNLKQDLQNRMGLVAHSPLSISAENLGKVQL